jgi:hypothetical protein
MTQLIFMGDVCFELGWGTRDLEQRCGNSIVRDVNGMRCVPSDLVQEMILERDAHVEAQRLKDQQRRAELAAGGNQMQDYVKAIQAAQARQRAEGLELDDLSLPAGALAQMTAADHVARISERDEAMAEMMQNSRDGSMIYHPVRREDDGMMTYHPVNEKWE